jgi:hypothetical protein
MGFILFLIASLLWLPLTLLNVAIVVYKNYTKSGFFKVINTYFFGTAIDIDRFGNRNFRTLLNCTLQKDGYQFGNEKETISSALGKNKKLGSLTKTGNLVCNILDFLDENHCKNSINENV